MSGVDGVIGALAVRRLRDWIDEMVGGLSASELTDDPTGWPSVEALSRTIRRRVPDVSLPALVAVLLLDRAAARRREGLAGVSDGPVEPLA